MVNLTTLDFEAWPEIAKTAAYKVTYRAPARSMNKPAVVREVLAFLERKNGITIETLEDYT